jgi:hypothetical protein
MKKLILTILFSFISNLAHSQCYELLSNKLDSTENLPYGLHEKAVYSIPSGKTISLKIRDVKYKSKFAFLFQWHDLGDTMDVTLVTLNWKVLARKTITKNDFILRYEPFKKSENYFLIVTTKVKLDSNKKPLTGCLGMAILERLTKRPFKKIQKIEWKIQD